MEKKTPAKSPVPAALDWVCSLAAAAVAVVLIFTFVGRTHTVSGPSMLPNFHDGDLIIGSNLFYEPKAGDVIFMDPGEGKGVAYIKRVIATEGQTIDIDFDQGIVTVDGKVLDEPYINEPTYTDEGMEFPATVPENCVFVMGDNRNNSKDSRHPDIGMVDKRQIIGKGLLRLMPFGDFGVIQSAQYE